jgi:hypothetical protein
MNMNFRISPEAEQRLPAVILKGFFHTAPPPEEFAGYTVMTWALVIGASKFVIRPALAEAPRYAGLDPLEAVATPVDEWGVFKLAAVVGLIACFLPNFNRRIYLVHTMAVTLVLTLAGLSPNLTTCLLGATVAALSNSTTRDDQLPESISDMPPTSFLFPFSLILIALFAPLDAGHPLQRSPCLWVMAIGSTRGVLQVVAGLKYLKSDLHQAGARSRNAVTQE